ncbi:MAG: SUF system NifU family Fe-S cluster assembly protein [Dehalococcoidia bacterium]|nr:SUF system NifU family Fe-S cluster assembly protein [Dehalococcoidia bacterium]|tara:strand:- start:2166 stop:2612 length:447 start_codon:yes stop_codon:yes gene_type:complete
MALDDLNDLFQEIILDHYKNPRNKGQLDKPDLRAEGDNPFCGDAVQIDVALDNNNYVTNVTFSGTGCSISQAAASILSEIIKEKNLTEVSHIISLFRKMLHGETLQQAEMDTIGELRSLHGVTNFPIRIKCALLGPVILADSINEYSG